MKRFTLRTVTFLGIPVVLYLMLFFMYGWLVKNEVRNAEVIILGDSQSQLIQEESVFNYSVRGAPYFVHLSFAERFEKELENKRVMISFNYPNLSAMYDNRLYNDNLIAGYNQKVYNELNTFRIFQGSYWDLPFERSFSAKQKVDKLFRLHYIVFGEDYYRNLPDRSGDRAFMKSIADVQYRNEKHKRSNALQVYYLEELVKKLKSLNCEVSVIKMPVTDYYRSLVPERITASYDSLIDSMDVTLIDLQSELGIGSDESLFKDWVHLREAGVKKMMDHFGSNYLNK